MVPYLVGLGKKCVEKIRFNIAFAVSVKFLFLFLAIAVAISFLMPRSFLGSGLGGKRVGRGSWFYMILFSLCEAGILVAVVLSFLPQKIMADLNPLIGQFFVGAVPQFFWILLPMLVLVLLKPGRTEL